MSCHHQSKKRLLAGIVAGSFIAMAAAPAAWAQTANATLRGTGPAGATVTARNVATGAVRVTRTGKNGSYALVGLQPGTYRVDAGPGTEHTITLTVASTATLNLAAPATTAAPAAAANATNLNAVTVSATTLREVKTPEVGGTISLRQIQTIPQISRNFLEFADTVPGMVFTANANGNTSLRGGAQNDSSVNVFIDGVGQKSYVKEGGVAGQIGSQGNPFPELAIGEYKVITSNYKAEYDQISSAAVTAQTKSGTNEFHGEFFDRYTNDAFRSRTPAESEPHARKTQSEEREYGFALGGPIIKDKMHFFVTYEGKRFDTPVTVVPSADASPGVPYLPADVASQLGSANLPFKENLYFGKIDWEPTTRDRFEVTAQIRKEDQTGGIGDQTAPSAAYVTKNDDKRYSVRWQHSGEAYYNELIATYEDSFNQPTATNYGNGYVYTWERPTDDPVIVSTGAATPLATQNKGQKGPSFEDNLTFNDLEWHGDHVVKMGIKKKNINLEAADAADVNPQFYYNVTPGGTAATPYKAFFTKPVNGLGLTPTVKTKSHQFGAYIQDDWDVNDKLTLNLGVRWDYERTPSYTDFVTPANVVAAFNSQDPNAPAGQTYAQTLAKGGIDINDYISTGHNRSAYKGEWQPRLGFSYDLNADQAHVIHGGIGRSYDRDLYDYLQLETTKAALPQQTIYFADPATGACHKGSAPCYPWDPSYFNGLGVLQALLGPTSNAGAELDMLNNKLKAPYSDQFSLGMSNQVGAWQTDATVARVLSYDGFAFTLGNRYPDGSFFNNPQMCNPTADPKATQPWGCPVPGFGSLILGNNGIRTRTTQLLLSAEKPYTRESGWGATFAYTYTDAKQNRDINEHYSFDYATIKDYPFITSNAVSKHRFVATGNMDGPWGLVLSAKLTLATPMPYNGVPCYTDVMFGNGSYCRATAATPSASKFILGGKIWGYRDVDFQATKNFDLGHGITLYGRFDVLNVFNWENFVDFTTSGPDVYPVQVAYNRKGNITFVPRTFKFEVGMRF